MTKIAVNIGATGRKTSYFFLYKRQNREKINCFPHNLTANFFLSN